MAVAGKICNRHCFIFEWEIDDFMELSSEVDSFYGSPSFEIFDAKWIFRIYPNGASSNETDGCVTLCLCKIQSNFAKHSLHFKLGIRRNDETEYDSFEAKENFLEGDYCGYSVLTRDQLLRAKDVVSPQGKLTIFCLFYNCENTVEDAVSVKSLQEDWCIFPPLESFEEADGLAACAGSNPCEQERSNEATEKNVDCLKNEDIAIKEDDKDKSNEENADHSRLEEDLQSHLKGFAALSQNLEDLFISGKLCDVTLKVQERVFHAHKLILGARSAIFASMFQEDRNSSVVDIADCDPSAFGDFLYYLYTAKVDRMSPGNVTVLYRAAAKYGVKQLKSECACFMKENLSVGVICEVLVVARVHSERDLSERAVEFFLKNAQEILATDKWQTFMKNYPQMANELCLKAFCRTSEKTESL